ncbi:hypothetical protein ABT288_12495 [Streptomyces sp. NPDC001093]|uniref:hypothetical protein n=1 Tax=Streptomyces sp. NPDC001093 TaxID=3154376 RepID=UPI0033191383
MFAAQVGVLAVRRKTGVALLRQIDDVRAPAVRCPGVGQEPLVPTRQAGQDAGCVIEVQSVDDETRGGFAAVPLMTGKRQGERAWRWWAEETGEAVPYGVEVVTGLDCGGDAGVVVFAQSLLDHLPLGVAVLVEYRAVAGGQFLAGDQEGLEFVQETGVVVDRCQCGSGGLEGGAGKG